VTVGRDGKSPPDPTDRATLIEEYELLHNATGAVTLGRDVLRVSGVDAVEYLQGQLSQDVAALARGESADSLILTPQGKLDALVRVSRTGDEEVIIDVDAGFGETVAARLARFKLRVKVDIEALAWGVVALRGPSSAGAAAGVEGQAGTALHPTFSWNGVSGVDLLGQAPVVPGAVRPCSVAAWESVRVEAGIPVMGAELDERTIAAEADLLDRAVSFTKGCYTGQELVARLDARGNRVARHLRGLVVLGLAPGGTEQAPGSEVVAPGSEVVFEGKVVGAVTSSAWSPRFNCPVALAYVHRTVEPPSAVQLRRGAADAPDAGSGETVDAEVRALPLR
jgi:tRNA-modifying protein YgfZ